ncbi:hypothetical protein BT67DRAFT_417944 [Trichocladium antarcticum]|uniref:CFEM domain-containing protein n=1 Tax=Trichocladium antarcticum TaxID=1450529 RepID=A0AAN6UNI8_9PEZI|nr:hypothetical protein BT67DRAFT_417944 [Trichocladium antarcticum]
MWSIRNTCAILGLCLLFPRHAAAAGSISLAEASAALPDCARTCWLSTISESTCHATDVNCLCANRSLNPIATACIAANCTIKESLTAKNTTSHLCGLPPRKIDSSIIPIYSVFIALAVVAVALRLIARVLTHAYFWWDDLSNLFAFASSAVFTGVNIKAIELGQGKDIWTVPFDNVTKVVHLFFSEMLLYTITRFFVRMSIILFYLRVFPPRSDNNLGRILQYTMAFNVVYNISFFFAVLFQCQPIPLFWQQWEGHDHGHCGNANILAWVAAVTGIVFDIWLLVLPFPQLLRLNLHWKKKVMGGMMFCVGAAVMIISLIRLKTINEFTRAANPTKDIVQVCLWSAIELDVGVICPCLPSFRLLLRRLLPRIVGTSGRYEMDPMTGGTTANHTAVARSRARKSQGVGRLGSLGSVHDRGGAAADAADGKIYVENEVVITSKSRYEGGKGGGDAGSCASVTGLVDSDEESGGVGRGK